MPIGSSRAPKSGAREPSAASSDEQVALGDAELDVLSLAATSSTAAATRFAVVGVDRALRLRGRRSPRRLTQGPRFVEMVTSGDVVTMRSASSGARRAMVAKQPAEALLRRELAPRRAASNPIGHRQSRGASLARGPRAGRTARSSKGRSSSAAARREPANGSHSSPSRDVHPLLEGVDLIRRHQAGVIVLVRRRTAARSP